MPTNTYVALGTITLASTDSEIVFSSIPATYRDLILVVSGTASSSGTVFGVRLNSDTGSNYSRVLMQGIAAGAQSASATDTSIRLGAITSTVGNFILQFMDYSATDKHKTVLSRNSTFNDTFAGTIAQAARWANTSAITTIRLAPEAGSLNSGTICSLYGIAG